MGAWLPHGHGPYTGARWGRPKLLVCCSHCLARVDPRRKIDNEIIALVVRAKVWVLGVSAVAIMVLSYFAYRDTWSGPRDYGWFAYEPFSEQGFYPEQQPDGALSVVASLLPMVIGIACVGMLALGSRLPRFNAGVVVVTLAAAILTGTAAYLSRGGAWASGGDSRRYADYLSDERVNVIDLAGVAGTLQLVSVALLIIACALSFIGLRRSSRQQPAPAVS